MLAVLLVALAVGASSAPQASAANLVAPKRLCPDLKADGNAKAMMAARNSMVCMVNYARRKSGLKRYSTSQKLNWSARRKSGDILKCGFSHGACGRPFDFWIRRSGYLGKGGWSTGENIALGSGYLGNVRSIFIAWMNSKGHREAILSTGYRDIGAGVVRGHFQGSPGARIWVLHFGRN